jgi:hypothetical protein
MTVYGLLVFNFRSRHWRFLFHQRRPARFFNHIVTLAPEVETSQRLFRLLPITGPELQGTVEALAKGDGGGALMPRRVGQNLVPPAQRFQDGPVPGRVIQL